MIHNSLFIGHPTLVVDASLFILLNLKFNLMSFLYSFIFLSSFADLVCKIRMFLCYFYLFFQPLLFIMEFAQAVFKQLSL